MGTGKASVEMRRDASGLPQPVGLQRSGGLVKLFHRCGTVIYLGHPQLVVGRGSASLHRKGRCGNRAFGKADWRHRRRVPAARGCVYEQTHAVDLASTCYVAA